MAVERISAKQLKEIVARIAYAKASVPTACRSENFPSKWIDTKNRNELTFP